MKKMLKRLCTGFLALATVVTALPTTPVHAESKQYWTESAERVGIIETVHRQNVEKVVSQETRQNYIKDRRTKVQQTQSVQKNQQTTEKTRNLVTKKGQKKK